MTTTRTTAERIAAQSIPTDRHGFPLTHCSRCGGSGTYPSVCYQGKCLGCGGTGYKPYNRSTARQQKLFRDAIRVDRPVTDITVGDRVYFGYGLLGNIEAVATVTDVRLETGDFGSSRMGDIVTLHDARVIVTVSHRKFGTAGMSYPFNQAEGCTAQIPTFVSVDPAPYVAKIKL